MWQIKINLKAIAKGIIPPIILAAIRRSTTLRLARSYPLSKGVSIVNSARQHFEQVIPYADNHVIRLNKRWSTGTEKIRSDISKLTATQDLIYYGQSQYEEGEGAGFDNRRPNIDVSYFRLYKKP